MTNRRGPDGRYLPRIEAPTRRTTHSALLDNQNPRPGPNECPRCRGYVHHHYNEVRCLNCGWRPKAEHTAAYIGRHQPRPPSYEASERVDAAHSHRKEPTP